MCIRDRSYSVEGDEAAARAEYARIARRAEYPFVHRMEAEDLSGEPRSTRTEPPQVQGYAAEAVSYTHLFANTGNRMAARIAMMAITTSNSISVKPRLRIALLLPSHGPMPRGTAHTAQALCVVRAYSADGSQCFQMPGSPRICS